MNKKDLTAPCGIDCFNCDIYKGNITEIVKKAVAKNRGIKEEDVPCEGCIGEKGHCSVFSDNTTCATYECITGKGLRFCFECSDFPCSKLQPLAEGASHYPHNMKVYNLCRMKAVGVEEWAEKESKEIRKRYFQGKFKIGAGPQL